MATSTDVEVQISSAFDIRIFFSLAFTFISSNHSFAFCIICSKIIFSEKVFQRHRFQMRTSPYMLDLLPRVLHKVLHRTCITH
jgi:hypothetical protein